MDAAGTGLKKLQGSVQKPSGAAPAFPLGWIEQEGNEKTEFTMLSVHRPLTAPECPYFTDEEAEAQSS